MTKASFEERLYRCKEESWSVMGDSWRKVGEDILQAIEEVATNLGSKSCVPSGLLNRK